MSMSSITQVLVVDDEHIIRNGICYGLAELPNMKIIGQTGSVPEAIEFCEDMKPDLVLLNLKLNNIYGIETVPLLLKKCPKLKIIIITDSLDSSLVTELFEHGVVGFFNKEEGLKELIKAIQSVLSGYTYISPCINKKIKFAKQKLRSNPFDLLSERELQVVLLIYYNFSSNDICEKLDINVSTLKTYRSRLFEKLGIRNNVEIVILAERYGVFVEHKCHPVEGLSTESKTMACVDFPLVASDKSSEG